MARPSTKNLQALPGIAELKRLLQSLATLDAILCEDWAFRTYAFDSQWAPGETMGSSSNGSGDDLFVHFSERGAFIKGFAHESRARAVSSEQFYKGLPSELSVFLQQPAFDHEHVTFCIWRLSSDTIWSSAHIEEPPTSIFAALLIATMPVQYDFDGSLNMLELFDGQPASYKAWADEYYEVDLPISVVSKVYAHEALTPELVKELKPGRNLASLWEDIEKIGYPR